MENKNIDEETDELGGEYLEKGIFREIHYVRLLHYHQTKKTFSKKAYPVL